MNCNFFRNTTNTQESKAQEKNKHFLIPIRVGGANLYINIVV